VSTTVSKHQNFVGGEWVDATGGETMEVLNPATGETIAEVPRSSAEDVDRAVQAAKKALPEWLETTPGERAEILLKLADALDQHGDEIAELESQNVGKPLSYAKDEIPVAVDNIRFFAGAARLLEGKSAGEYMRGYSSWLRREPIGIVGGIAPWNYPLMMAVWKLAPALAAGNVQVLKPSEQTPLTTLRFAQLAADILPAGVLNVVTGDGVPAGEAIVKHPDVRLVSLTGDVETGKIIARTAADTLKRVHLELGGKAPVIVFDDADPEAVAAGIKIGGFWNSGQDCTAASRVVAGPKTSRWTISSSWPTSTTTVGLTKKPRLPFDSPPVRTVAFLARSRKPSTRSCWDFEITGPISISSPSAGSPTCSDSTAGTSSSSNRS